ncbi:urease accessory protein UreD [Alkalimarinus coralli]|uniref:urease accessory protein UreD n=1 Tax=Alkalimarinus coralli TaxID=2935863 RepID=UPI00202AFE53|nr:urease accessory protein UreD [Alkalimarinus coralli]
MTISQHVNTPNVVTAEDDAVLAAASMIDSTIESRTTDSGRANFGYGESRRWLAELSLEFVAGADKTLMKDFQFKGPLRVQRPFYPENKVCHVYILHPPGGLVSGDNLKIDITCAKNSHVLMTTPSAGKVYQADSCNVSQLQDVKLSVDDAICEWFPQETIVFNGANGRLSTHIDLTGNAKFIGWDIYCLGRTAGNKPFDSGSVVQTLSVSKDGLPLLLERQVVKGGGESLTQPYGFAGHSVSGTMIMFGLENPQASVDALRSSLEPLISTSSIAGLIAVTQRLGVVIVRYLGPCSEEAKNLLIHCWKQVRKALLGLEACEPRIWST